MKAGKFINKLLDKLIYETFRFLKYLFLFTFGYWVVPLVWNSDIFGKIILIFNLVYLISSSVISVVHENRAEKSKKETINWN
jgi:hypothetical protein